MRAIDDPGTCVLQMDPRRDPTVHPAKAKRILANRLSAAKSKMKAKSQTEVTPSQMLNPMSTHDIVPCNGDPIIAFVSLSPEHPASKMLAHNTVNAVSLLPLRC